MTTNELEGRALHEAAARAMPGGLTIIRMLDWLHERVGHVHMLSAVGSCNVGSGSTVAGGRDLSEALARLVVAVAAREAKQA